MIPLNKNLLPLQRSGIRVYTNLARQTPDCAMLTIGEPDLDTPESIKAAVAASLAANQTHYAPNQGTARLRQAVADFETARGNRVTPEQVLITVGATHALFTALLGILNPGEEVIIPTPGFGLYETIATIAGAKAVALDVTRTGFQITKEALDAAPAQGHHGVAEARSGPLLPAALRRAGRALPAAGRPGVSGPI